MARHLVKGRDQKSPGTAGRIDNGQCAQFRQIGQVERALRFIRLRRMDRFKRCKTLFQRQANGALHQKARHHVRRIDHALLLALGDIGWCLAPAFGLEFLDIGDRLLEDMAQHGHRDFVLVVPLAEARDLLGQFIGQDQCIRHVVPRKQPAIISGNAHFAAGTVVAAIHIGKQGEKVFPDRLGQKVVFLLGCQLQQFFGQQVGALRKSDEQDSVEDFLGHLDGGEHGKHRAIRPIGQKIDETIPQALVVCVELAGNVLVGAVCLAQQMVGLPPDKALGREQQPQTLVLVPLIQSGEIKDFIGIAAPAKGIKPKFDAIRDEHPARSRRIHRIIPSLLDGRTPPPRHDAIQIIRIRPLDLHRCKDDIRCAIKPECAERNIG